MNDHNLMKSLLHLQQRGKGIHFDGLRCVIGSLRHYGVRSTCTSTCTCTFTCLYFSFFSTIFCRQIRHPANFYNMDTPDPGTDPVFTHRRYN